MRSGPSQTAEKIVSVFLPPACREEVLGDLFERYRSPHHYALDALRAVPLVIASRIRRTADPQVLVIQAFVLYGSFLGAAWSRDRELLGGQWGLARLAVPAAMGLLGLMLDDVYAHPGRRSALSPARGPLLGFVFVLVSQQAFQIGNPAWALPDWITLTGCGMGLLLSTVVRVGFPPLSDRLQGAAAPAHWLKQGGAARGAQPGEVRWQHAAFLIVTLALVGTWMLTKTAQPAARIVPMLVGFVVALRVWSRS